MPCNDITDRLKVTLDDDNRVVAYTLAKRTCGAEVGDYALIADWAVGRTTDDILAATPDLFLETKPPADDTEEFLFLKHFFSLQNGLEAVTGHAITDSGDEKCTIDRVEYGPEGLDFTASIKIDAVTTQIKSCGGCSRGCGVKSVTKTKLAVTIALATLIFPSLLYARPPFAIQEGVSCGSCHVNPTGAGKRNDKGGQLWTQDLALKATRHLAPKNVSGRLTSFAAVGTDLHARNTTTFSSPVSNMSTIPQGSLYGEFNAGKHLLGYVDYDIANTVNRELFLLLHELPMGFHAKTGRINLPYGLRIADDSSFIRTNFNMTFANQDIGAEVGITPGPFELIAAVSNGVPGGIGDENVAKAVTTQANWIGEFGRLGTSFHWNRRSANELLMTGLHGGWKLWRTLWLGEIDLQRNHDRTASTNTWIVSGYGEIDWIIIDGLYLKSVYDVLDPDYSAPNNLQHRIGFGFDLYPLPYSHVSILYRVNVGAGIASDDQLLAELHFFF